VPKDTGASAVAPPTSGRGTWGMVVYFVVTFGGAWLLELGPVRARGLRSGHPVVILAMVGVMFCPAVGALMARLVEGCGFEDARLRWGKGRFVAVAWLLPFVLVAIAVAVTALLGAGTFDPSGQTILAALPAAKRAEAARQIAAFGPWLLPLTLLSALTMGIATTSMATFGEEFGWRGYLQPRLVVVGRAEGMALVGLIWGLWHAPAILLGLNYPGHPLEGVLLMTVFCVLLALIFGWLFDRANSLLAPVIAHASLNSAGGSLAAFVGATDPTIGGLAGVVTISVLLLFVLGLWVAGELDG